MKKILFFCLSALAMALTTASCGNDDNDVRTFTNTPEIDMAGTYSGTFSRVQVGAAQPDTTYADGTITLTAGRAYVANAVLTCSEFAMTDSVALNVAHSDDGFAFSNNLSTNAIGAPIFGRIDGSSNMIAHFQLKMRSGRSTKTYNLVFSGKKDFGAK